MPATTIKISTELRNRVALAAKKAGTTAHAFLVQAVEKQTEFSELRLRFVTDALAAEQDVLRTGLGYRADEVHAYFDARIRGKKPRRPKAKAWRK